MMKRKFLAVILPIIGCATVVGSGFSAWYFGDPGNAKREGSFGVNIDITEEVKDATNSLTISTGVSQFNGYKLLLDQGGYANKSNLDSGIMFTNKTPTPAQVSTTSTIDWNFNVKYSSSSTSIKQLYEAGLQIRFEFKITLSEGKDDTSKGLNDYIKVKPAVVGITSKTGNLTASSSKFDSSDGVTYSAQYTLDGSGLNTKNAVYQFTLDMDTTGPTFSNALFQYIQKPQDEDGVEYQDMTEALSDANITFAVIAHLETAGTGA